MSTETATVAPPTQTNEHEDHGHEKRPYMAIFWALLGLTVMEVSTIFIAIPENLHYILVAPFLMAVAIGKAGLVAAYYMHLRYDPRMLTAIFLGPFVLAILFGVILVTQYT